MFLYTVGFLDCSSLRMMFSSSVAIVSYLCKGMRECCIVYVSRVASQVAKNISTVQFFSECRIDRSWEEFAFLFFEKNINNYLVELEEKICDNFRKKETCYWNNNLRMIKTDKMIKIWNENFRAIWLKLARVLACLSHKRKEWEKKIENPENSWSS